jgi:hypothetical protein
MAADEAVAGEATELLQSLIRNKCVSDGTDSSGREARNSELLANYLSGAGIELERVESTPDRESLVARAGGSDPTAPRLCLWAPPTWYRSNVGAAMGDRRGPHQVAARYENGKDVKVVHRLAHC